MRIKKITPLQNCCLDIELSNGKKGILDMQGYLHLEAFEELHDENEFQQVKNGGYFIEWKCGADLSLDTILSHSNFQN